MICDISKIQRISSIIYSLCSWIIWPLEIYHPIWFSIFSTEIQRAGKEKSFLYSHSTFFASVLVYKQIKGENKMWITLQIGWWCPSKWSSDHVSSGIAQLAFPNPKCSECAGFTFSSWSFAPQNQHKPLKCFCKYRKNLIQIK